MELDAQTQKLVDDLFNGAPRVSLLKLANAIGMDRKNLLWLIENGEVQAITLGSHITFTRPMVIRLLTVGTTPPAPPHAPPPPAGERVVTPSGYRPRYHYYHQDPTRRELRAAAERMVADRKHQKAVKREARLAAEREARERRLARQAQRKASEATLKAQVTERKRLAKLDAQSGISASRKESLARRVTWHEKKSPTGRLPTAHQERTTDEK